MITDYRCASCQVSSAVELVASDTSREREGTLAADLRAKSELLFATCPACDTRNPDGVAEQQRDERNLLIFTLVFMVGLTIAAYFVLWLVLGWLGLFVALYLFIAFRHRVTWGLILNLVTTLGLAAVVWLAPRWAFLVVAIPTIQMLMGRRDPAERDGPWQRAAEQLRFFDTAERRP